MLGNQNRITTVSVLANLALAHSGNRYKLTDITQPQEKQQHKQLDNQVVISSTVTIIRYNVIN